MKSFLTYGLATMLLFLFSCRTREEGSAPTAESLYNMGRYASLADDWTGAVDYFQQSVTAALASGDCYYEGYSRLQLAVLWAREEEYSRALYYALSATECLDACGEFVGASFSRLSIAWQYVSMGEDDMARSLVDAVHAAFPSPDSPMAYYIDHLYSIIGN